MEFKSNISKEEYLKKLNIDTEVNKEEEKVSLPQTNIEDVKQQMSQAYQNNDIEEMIELEEQTKLDKVKESFSKLKQFSKQTIQTKKGNIEVYSNDLIANHYKGNKRGNRIFVLTAGSMVTCAVFPNVWLKLMTGVGALWGASQLYHYYQITDKDINEEMIEYIEENEKVRRK